MENIRESRTVVMESLNANQLKACIFKDDIMWLCTIDTRTLEVTVKGVDVHFDTIGSIIDFDTKALVRMHDRLDGGALSELPAIGEYPEGLCWEEDLLRYCDVCGRNMSEGFVINGGEEYYCDEECLHTEYSKGEYLAMYAGLDNTDEAEVARALAMSQDELDALSEENDSQTYWSTFED